jgi:hypothetical protein
MARMSKEEPSDIIHRDKPGYEIVERQPVHTESGSETSDAGGITDRVTDLDELRRRYLGDSAVANSPGGAALGETAVDAGDEAADDSDDDDDEDEIVVLSPPANSADPWAPGPGRKSVIVSGRERRVIAEQG